MPTFLLTLTKYWKPLVALVAIVAAFMAGKAYESNACEVEKAEIVQQFTQLIQEEVDRRYQVSQVYEQRMQELRDTTRTITEVVEVEVEKPVYRECKVPKSGVELLNQNINKLNSTR